MATVALARPRRNIAQALSLAHVEVAALVAVSATLDFFRLSQNGSANVFYSAAVRSMAASWHNFFYASQDPAGIMTIDKPPLAIWVQALSVRVFGYSPLAILIPQAVIGTLTVVLVYDLVRRRFGRLAGFVGGLALATTPITVAMSRHNNPDALLALLCVAALWCTARALERERSGWLMVAGVCVGLAFETKMAVALLVVPGIAAAWLWVAPLGRLRALGQLLKGGAAAVAVACAWPLFMALTPASQRPWISGTNDNSIWSLIVGYNGVGRVAGQAGGPTPQHTHRGSFVFGGVPSPSRLLDAALGVQGGWLVGFALAALIIVAAASRLRRADPRSGWLIAVAGAFVVTAVVFSAAQGIFHPYYVSLLAPFTAALVGAGVGEIARRGQAARVVAPLALVAGAASEAAVVHQNTTQPLAVIPFLVGGALLFGCVLALAPLGARLRNATVAAALAGLLVLPAIAAAQTLGYRTSSTFPTGGPHVELNAAPRHSPLHRRASRNRRELVAVLRYTRAHGGGAIGVRSQEQAAYAIIGYHGDVAGLGGFSGQETQVDPAWFGQAVRARHIRWVLFNGRARIRAHHRIGATRLLKAVAHDCRRVPPAAYTHTTGMTRGALYDCAGRGARFGP